MADNPSREERPDVLLDRYWDEIQASGGWPSPPAGLDPSLTAALRDLHRGDRSLTASRPFAAHLWEELMDTPAVAHPNHPLPSEPAAAGPRRAAPVPTEHHLPRRLPAGALAAAAMVVLTLAAGALAFRLAGPPGEGRPTFAAQGDAGNRPPAGHPLVGSWLVSPVTGGEQDDAPVMIAFNGDGTVVAVALNTAGPDRLALGAWEADGDDAARFAYRTTDSVTDPAFGGRNSIAGTSEVDTSGDGWTGSYVVVKPESGQDQAAPSLRTAIEAVRIAVAPADFTEPDAIVAESPTSSPAEQDLPAGPLTIAAVDIGWEHEGRRSAPGQPVVVEVAPGDTLSLPNNGAVPHTFAVEALDSSVVEIPVGQSASYTVPADTPPGDYEFVCILPGHDPAGMVGILRVREPGAANERPTPEPSPLPTEPAPVRDASVTIAAVDIGWQYDGERSMPGQPVRVPVSPGDVIALPNEGALPHNFVVPSLDNVLVDMPVDQTATYTVPADAPPGEYEFICNLPGHEQAGQVGILVVEPPD